MKKQEFIMRSGEKEGFLESLLKFTEFFVGRECEYSSKYHYDEFYIHSVNGIRLTRLFRIYITYHDQCRYVSVYVYPLSKKADFILRKFIKTSFMYLYMS